LRDTPGAARRPTQTVEEMARRRDEARAMAVAADTGKLTRSPASSGEQHP